MNQIDIAAKRLKTERERKGITLTDLERMTGIGKSTLNRYENGYFSTAPIDKVKKIAAALGIDLAWLLGYTDEGNSIDEQIIAEFRSLTVEQKKEILRYVQFLKSE